MARKTYTDQFEEPGIYRIIAWGRNPDKTYWETTRTCYVPDASLLDLDTPGNLVQLTDAPGRDVSFTVNFLQPADRVYSTKWDVVDYAIIPALGEWVDDYDLDGITDEAVKSTDDGGYYCVTGDEFWDIVQEHDNK